MKPALRTVDGLLLVDKPAGVSSNAVLQRVKRLFRARKAGHGGTLDPLASGLLPVLFGDATKFAERVLGSRKTYCATLQLGETTSTGDAEGEITQRRPVAVERARVDEILQRFTGAIQQMPPMYSALKHKGQPLYTLARKGLSVVREPREVTIYGLKCLEFAPPRLLLRVDCSKGTYVRVLGEDIGEVLGTGAHLAGLRRESVGTLSVADALSPSALEEMSEQDRDAVVLPLERLLEDAPRVALDSSQAGDFRNGKALRVKGLAAGQCAVFGPGARFLGIGEVTIAEELRPRRLLAQRPSDGAQAAEIS